MTDRELTFWERAYLNGITSVRAPNASGHEVALRAKTIADEAFKHRRAVAGLPGPAEMTKLQELELECQNLEKNLKHEIACGGRERLKIHEQLDEAERLLVRFTKFMEDRSRSTESWQEDELQILYTNACQLVGGQPSAPGEVRPKKAP